MKKTTLATIHSFIRREAGNDNLYVKATSSFNGMTDCVEDVEDSFRKVIGVDWSNKNSLGIPGAWFVRSSRDYFMNYADENFIGYKISNCCGNFIVAMKRLY